MQAHPLQSAIEMLAAMPAFVEGALARVPRSRWSHKPAPEAFSLAGFDGATVARERGYLEQDAKRAAQEFAAARRELVALLGATTPADLARTATFMDERVTLERLVGTMVEHDGEHREEIAALARELEEAGWK